MPTRERPADVGAREARSIALEVGRELRAARRRAGMSQDRAGRRATMSRSQFGRIERGEAASASIDQIARAARAVGLKASVRLYPDGIPIRDVAQLALLDRLERILVAGMRLRREVGLPIAGDQRAWDGRISDGQRTASIEGESRLEDVQAVSRRIALKQRDDPSSGVVILLVNRTARNRRVLAEQREALRAQFPLDGAAILRALRAAKIPPASGILLL